MTTGKKWFTHPTDTDNDCSDEENSNPNRDNIDHRPKKKVKKARSGQFQDLTDLVTESSNRVVAATEKQSMAIEQHNKNNALLVMVIAEGLDVNLDKLRKDIEEEEGKHPHCCCHD
ncbi:hypothetical protein PM082_024410 [Marasmius tenuissimus]|nr:hypothetical protein PM082_024410 [Marasmius tenuissimus]